PLLEQVLDDVGGLDAGDGRQVLDEDRLGDLDLAAGDDRLERLLGLVLTLLEVSTTLAEEPGRALEPGVEFEQVSVGELGRPGRQAALGVAAAADVARTALVACGLFLDRTGA